MSPRCSPTRIFNALLVFPIYSREQLHLHKYTTTTDLQLLNYLIVNTFPVLVPVKVADLAINGQILHLPHLYMPFRSLVFNKVGSVCGGL